MLSIWMTSKLCSLRMGSSAAMTLLRGVVQDVERRGPDQSAHDVDQPVAGIAAQGVDLGSVLRLQPLAQVLGLGLGIVIHQPDIGQLGIARQGTGEVEVAQVRAGDGGPADSRRKVQDTHRNGNPEQFIPLRIQEISAGFRILAALWVQAVAIAQFSRRLQVFSRSHQFGDLPDMSQIVHGPLVQHLLQGDFADLLVPGATFPGASRQSPQKFQIRLALILKVVEGIFRIGIAI